MRILFAPFWIVARAIAGLVRILRKHPGWSLLGAGGAVGVLAVFGLLFTLQRPPPESIQLGYRGTGMGQVYDWREADAKMGLQRVDAPLPSVVPAGRTAGQVYKNIKVLQAVDANEFLRLMAAMTQWVAPQAGCAFCHSLNNMADDSVYTKTVARRMLQMTMAINADWRSHVGADGVTCQTCHRGNGIPDGSWFTQPPPHGTRGITQADSGQNLPAAVADLSSYPYDPLTPFLLQSRPIRVTGTTALPSGNRASINQTDWTYSLMIHFSESLGVNCTYCHNTRAFEEWDQGTPHRVTAWHAIPMVRTLNNEYMVSLTHVFPREMRGAEGDVAKVSCVSCHAGAYKPFYGASTLAAYPELAPPATARTTAAATPPAAILNAAATSPSLLAQNRP